MTEEQYSEFGQGFAYCLGLFLCHDERRHDYMEKEKTSGYTGMPEMWFNGAADHLFDKKIPEFKYKQLAEELVGKSLKWRLTMGQYTPPTWDDTKWAIQTAKDLLRYWDEANNIETVKGAWE